MSGLFKCRAQTCGSRAPERLRQPIEITRRDRCRLTREMRGLKLVVLALLLMGFDPGILKPAQGQPAYSDDGEALVILMEKHVGLVAQEAVKNLLNEQDLIASCGTSCSRGECLPLSTDLESYNCSVTSDKLAGCSSQTVGQQCNNVRTTLLKGYVRTPLNTSGSQLGCEIRKSVCVQRNLDPVFQAAAQEYNKYNLYINFKFGSVAGDFRYFPGREAVIRCKDELYDPRIRPWYTEPIAVAKNMVVLLDNGALMKESVSPVKTTSTFAVAQQFIELLLAASATEGDNLTVISFNKVASLVGQVVVGIDASESLQPLLAKVEGAVPLDEASNLTAGLELARAQHIVPGAPLCKIAVVLTDKGFDPSRFNQSISDILALGVKLFIYAVGGSQNASCYLYHFEGLGPVALDNPLYGFKAFFSFLARSRKEAYNNTGELKPHWRSVYDSSARIGLGQIVTVGMPALDDNGQLVGVAGIDVPISSVEKFTDLKRAFTGALDRRRAPLPNNVSGADVCQDSGQVIDTQSCQSGIVPVAVCPADSNLTNFQLLCCEGCGGSSLANTSICGAGGQQCDAIDPSPAPPETSSAAGPQTGCSGDCGGGNSAPIEIIVPVVVVAASLVVVADAKFLRWIPWAALLGWLPWAALLGWLPSRDDCYKWCHRGPLITTPPVLGQVS